MAEELNQSEQSFTQEDPLSKLYRNAQRGKLQVGTFDNFKSLMAGKDSRSEIYRDLVSSFGDKVKTVIGTTPEEFTSRYGGQKKNILARLKEWWTDYFIPCCIELKSAILG